MLVNRTIPPSELKLSSSVGGARRGIRRHHGRQRASWDTKVNFFAFHVSADLRPAAFVIDTPQERIPSLSAVMYEGDCAAEEYDHHTIKDHPCRGWPTIRPKVLVKAAKKALQAKSQVQRRMLTSPNSPS
jgi:hypothetical protein